MVFFWIALSLGLAGLHIFRRRHEERTHSETAAVFLRYWLGIAIGIASIVGGLFHVFDGTDIAREICFTRGDGGFQFENAMGDIAIGVAGFLCLFIRDPRFWLTVIIIATIQFWGDAYGHVYQMIENDNHCTDNTGPVLWMDIAGPLVAIVLYAVMRRGSTPDAA
jgi:hypothetical protein